MKALADFGDRQWLQALAAVLVGLMLAGEAAHRAGPVAVVAPLLPGDAAIAGACWSHFGGALARAAGIMPHRQGPRG